MKNAIIFKTVLLFVAVSMIYLCVSGCGYKKTQEQIAVLQEEAVTSYVNLTNPNGSVTPVKITRQGNVWVGPRGERYNSYPTAEQLQPIYGVK